MKVNYLVKSFIFFASVLLSASAFARDASLSTDTININTDEIGSFTISGNDDGDDNFQFRWDIPSGLNVTKGSSSNLNKFDIDWDKMRIKVESDARGSFSATINVSASNSGTFVLNNTRAEISLSPRDVTISVGGSGGGGGSTPPPEPPPPTDGGGGGGGSGSGSGTADYTLYIEPGFHTINGDGGEVINVWGYTSSRVAAKHIPLHLTKVVCSSIAIRLIVMSIVKWDYMVR